MRKAQRKRRTRARQKWKREHPRRLTREQQFALNRLRAGMILGEGLMSLFDKPEVTFGSNGSMTIRDLASSFVAGSRLRISFQDEHGNWHPPLDDGLTDEDQAMIRKAVHGTETFQLRLDDMLADDDG